MGMFHRRRWTDRANFFELSEAFFLFELFKLGLVIIQQEAANVEDLQRHRRRIDCNTPSFSLIGLIEFAPEINVAGEADVRSGSTLREEALVIDALSVVKFFLVLRRGAN